jgi:hypothetical protein
MNFVTPSRAKRDAALVLIGAVTGVAALSASTRLVSSEKRQEVTMESRPSDDPGAPRGAPCSIRTEADRTVGPPANEDGSSKELKRVRSELQVLRLQRETLQEDLQSVEEELRKREEPPPYEYSLSPKQWRELSASGRIKYRVPCSMPADSTIDKPILDHLGLGPDDGEIVMEAVRRSNARLWATVRPMCLQLLGREELVDLLGFNSCKSLVEQTRQKVDPLAKHHAQRLVGEVRAGMREPPGNDEFQSPATRELYQIAMAATGEGELFESDLAESFGPEAAQRIWHSFPCAGTVR